MKKLLERKRIWEMDCTFLDAALAASFDWKEMANLLQSSGLELLDDQSDAVLEMQAQNGVHAKCHDANDLSLKIETLMNQWHARPMDVIAGMQPSEILWAFPEEMKRKGISRGGIFWALGTDPRPGFDCLRRHFYQRVQIRMMREGSFAF